MRLVVFCPSGQSRTLLKPDDTTVAELKADLEAMEGVPADQQRIMFAGRVLMDHVPLCDYALDQYTLADEVVIYMYCELRQPKLVYLCRGQDKSHMTTDLVEYSSPLSEVMGLLESRAMGAGFGGQTAVLAKRRDGSTIPVRLDPGMTLQDLEEAVAQHERVRPTTLVFYQAQDGHLHVTVTPSHDASSDTYPVYARPVLPQRPMFTKPKGTGQPMAELVRELCIMP